jgi:hypothetical protein
MSSLIFSSKKGDNGSQADGLQQAELPGSMETGAGQNNKTWDGGNSQLGRGNINMSDLTRPFLVLYVIWHPLNTTGASLAEALRDHFRRKLFANVAGGTGVSVIFRSSGGSEGRPPSAIDLEEAETTAAIVLAEQQLVKDVGWCAYIHELTERTEAAGFRARVFPVSLDEDALKLGVSEQALRWDQWPDNEVPRLRRLIVELTYELCRMLRYHLEHLKHPQEEEDALERFLQKVQIFISHSKHDEDGERIAHAIRDNLQRGHGLASFFDVYDIPAGIRFQQVLLAQLKRSAIVAVHTDSYSSRDWCQLEIIMAKHGNRPLLIANCLRDFDERGFPYMGNVPIVRMDPQQLNRIDIVIGRLLDEVLKDFLWRCRVELARALAGPEVVFLPRQPELISLTSCLPVAADAPDPMIVYPDPPLSQGELQLFARLAPRVRLRSMNAWLAAP